MDKENLLKKLKQDPIRNMSTIGFVENNQIEKVLNKKNSYIIIAESDHLWAYIVSNDRNELKFLILNNEIGTKYFASVEDWMLPLLTDSNENEWMLKTKRYYFPEDSKIEAPVNEVESLVEDDIEVILEHSNYAEYLSHNLLLKRMKDGPTAAIRVDGKLVAWGLTHDDKSLGFLHVLTEYRNNGYARDIGRYLVNKKREMNEMIYLNIEPDNKKSIKLTEGLGFKYDRNISWVKLK
ncbi:MAG: GNAT family N-acetyltransferase [Halanaerobiales bacterium]|nr:GNAT family N-acetyltransferase [Halanaerobiales bacterium]